MNARCHIAPNAVAYRYRALSSRQEKAAHCLTRDPLGRLCGLKSLHQTHNLVTTAGLEKLAGMIIADDDESLQALVVGDDDTAPALGDTALGNETLVFKPTISSNHSFERVVVDDTFIAIHRFTGFLRRQSTTLEIKEFGFETKTSETLFNRGVFDVPITLTRDDYVIFIINITFKGIGTSTLTWTRCGPTYMAQRMAEQAPGALGHMAFGTGTAAINPNETDELVSEVHRVAATYVRDGSTLRFQGLLTSGTPSSDLKEMGMAFGTTKGTGSGYLINNSGGYDKGTGTGSVDTGTGTILAGNYVRFDGVPHLYVVTSALSGGSFSWKPGLAAPVADNAAVTLVEPVLMQSLGHTADASARDIDYYAELAFANAV